MLRFTLLVTMFTFVVQHAQGASNQFEYWGVAETTSKATIDFLLDIGLVEIWSKYLKHHFC